MKDTIQWKAIYKDGSSLSQYNLDDTENGFYDIDLSNLDRFLLVKDNEVKVVVNLTGNRRLIMRRRRVKGSMASGEITGVIYLTGWQELVGGKNVQCIIVYFPEDDHIEVSDRFIEGHKFFSPVRLLPEEEVEHGQENL